MYMKGRLNNMDLKNLESIKYYEVHYYNVMYDGTPAGWVEEVYATKEEAEQFIAQQTEARQYKYAIVEKSILELIESEVKKAKLHTEVEVREKCAQRYDSYYNELYEKNLVKEKEKLKKEMKEILINWFDIKN